MWNGFKDAKVFITHQVLLKYPVSILHFSSPCRLGQQTKVLFFYSGKKLIWKKIAINPKKQCHFPFRYYPAMSLLRVQMANTFKRSNGKIIFDSQNINFLSYQLFARVEKDHSSLGAIFEAHVIQFAVYTMGQIVEFCPKIKLSFFLIIFRQYHSKKANVSC